MGTMCKRLLPFFVAVSFFSDANADGSNSASTSVNLEKFLSSLSPEQRRSLVNLSPQERQALVTLLKTQKAQKGVKMRSMLANVQPSGAPPNPPAVAQQPGQASPLATPCEDQRFELRRDRTDIFALMVPCGPIDALGASVSSTANAITNTETLTIQGLAGYTLYRNQGDTFAFAPTLQLNGSLAEPFKSSTEKSAIRGGLDTQFALDTPIVTTYLDVSPYAQTDFRGKAALTGVDLTTDLYNMDWFLGGRDNYGAAGSTLPLPLNIGAYWRLQPEADIVRVENSGLTNFTSNSTHAFVGGTVQAKAILFQNTPEVGPFLCGRIYVDGTGQFFQDLISAKDAINYQAEIGYYLGSGVAPFWRDCVPKVNGKSPEPTAGATSSSISFVYSNGTDKTTLVNQQQYKVQLNFKY